MNPNDLNSSRENLNQIIDEEIRTAVQSGPTDVDSIFAAVESRGASVIRNLLLELAHANVRSTIQKRLKHVVVSSSRENLAKAEVREQQIAFEGMEEFEGIPDIVSFADRPGHIAYQRYLSLTKAQRYAALAVLDKGIAEDKKKRDAMLAGNNFLDKLAVVYGDLPGDALLRAWLASGAKWGTV